MRSPITLARASDLMRACDICVIGGGPAGAVTALRLAAQGYDVVLVERATFPRSHIGESLPPSILPLLSTLGLRTAVEAAGFARPTGAVLHWAGVTSRRDFPTRTPGFQVDRARFDALVLEAVKSAGVQVIQPASAHRPRAGGGGWIVPLRGQGTPDEVRARYLVDAAGKRAGLARGAVRTGAPTAALYAYWPTAPGQDPDTRIEAAPEAWYWGAALPDGTFNATVFVDPERCAGRSPDQRRQLYFDLMERSALLAPCLMGSPVTPVRICDAASYAAADPIAPGLIRVGEGNLSLDPLSSQGVQSAMGMAVQAATVIHTTLTHPARATLAARFYRDRQAETVRMHAHLAADHYAAQQAYCDTPFWRARARVEEGASDPVPAPQTAPLPPDIPLTLARDAQIAPVPMIDGDMIGQSDGLVHPGLARPVIYLDKTPLAPLIAGLRPGLTLPQIIDAWSARLSAEQSARVLTWLWQHRILVSAGEG